MMTTNSELKPIEDQNIIDKVMDAAAQIDPAVFQRLSTGDNVDELSTNTVFESLEIAPDALFASSGDGFEASATIYITLNYGGSRDPVSIPDSYPAVVRGDFLDKNVNINEIAVDTGTFYE